LGHCTASWQKTAKYYVEQAVGQDDKERSNNITGKFLNKSGKVFLWPKVDDISVSCGTSGHHAQIV